MRREFPRVLRLDPEAWLRADAASRRALHEQEAVLRAVWEWPDIVAWCLVLCAGCARGWLRVMTTVET